MIITKIAATLGLVLLFPILSASSQTDLYILYMENDKVGLKNNQSEILIPAQYQQIGWSSMATAAVTGTIGYKENNLWGLMDMSGNKLTGAIFKHIEPFTKGHLLVDENGKRGLIQTSGKSSTSRKYNSLSPAGDHIIYSLSGLVADRYGLMNYTEKSLIAPDFSKIEYLPNTGLRAKTTEDKWQAFDSQGRLLSKEYYDEIQAFDQYLLLQKGNFFGMIDLSGKVLFEPQYKYFIKSEKGKPEALSYAKWKNHLNAGYASVIAADSIKPLRHDKLIAYYNSTLEILDDQYRVLRSWDNVQLLERKNDYLILKKGEKLAIYSLISDTITEFGYDDYKAFDQIVVVLQGQKWEIIEASTLRNIHSFGFQSVDDHFSGDLLAVRYQNRTGFISTSGEISVPFLYDQAEAYYHGYAIAIKDGISGIIDSQGNWTVNARYDSIKWLKPSYALGKKGTKGELVLAANDSVIFSSNDFIYAINGHFAYRKNKQYGLIDGLGKEVLKPIYDSIIVHSEEAGLFVVHQGKKKGLVNKEGKFKIPLSERFERIIPSDFEFLAVKINGQYGFVDFDGNLRIANRYDSVKNYQNGLAAIMLRSKWGFIDRSENIIIQPYYEEVSQFENGLASIRKNGKWGVLNLKGEEIVAPVYDRVERLSSGNFQAIKMVKLATLRKMAMYSALRSLMTSKNLVMSTYSSNAEMPTVSWINRVSMWYP